MLEFSVMLYIAINTCGSYAVSRYCTLIGPLCLLRPLYFSSPSVSLLFFFSSFFFLCPSQHRPLSSLGALARVNRCP
jgi:hypothetical protein